MFQNHRLLLQNHRLLLQKKLFQNHAFLQSVCEAHCLQQPMFSEGDPVGNVEKVVVFWYSRTLLRVANNVMVSMLHPRAVFKFCLTHHRPSWQESFAGKLWRRWARLGLRRGLYMIALSFIVGNYIWCFLALSKMYSYPLLC